jgi:hypothetical protein
MEPITIIERWGAMGKLSIPDMFGAKYYRALYTLPAVDAPG